MHDHYSMKPRPIQSPCVSISRRTWLSSATAGWAFASVRADEHDALRTRGREAGLGAFGVSQSDHYSGIGDAPEEFRRETLNVCESIANSYRAHFRKRGFTISLPKQPLTLVVLSGQRSY